MRSIYKQTNQNLSTGKMARCTDLGVIRIHERFAEAQQDSLYVNYERVRSYGVRVDLMI